MPANRPQNGVEPRPRQGTRHDLLHGDGAVDRRQRLELLRQTANVGDQIGGIAVDAHRE